MHGVPADLDLSFLHEGELVQLCLGLHEIQLHFHPLGHITIEGAWLLLDTEGRLIDGGPSSDHRATSQLHRLLGKKVVSSEVFPPESFVLRFTEGYALQVRDDSDAHESFSIDPGGIVA